MMIPSRHAIDLDDGDLADGVPQNEVFIEDHEVSGIANEEVVDEQERQIPLSPHVEEYFKRVHNPLNAHPSIGATVAAVVGLFRKFRQKRPRNLRQQVVRLCAECIPCKKLRAQRPDKRLMERHSLHGHLPFDDIQIDFISGFPMSDKGNKFVFVAICSFTKFVWLKAVSAETAEGVVDCLHDLTGYFGIPRRVASDGGAAFRSKLVSACCL